MSDANYPEPTGVWLFSHGHLVRGLGCVSGEPFKFRFESGGRTLALFCSFPHGPPDTHELWFDTATGREIGQRHVADHGGDEATLHP